MKRTAVLNGRYVSKTTVLRGIPWDCAENRLPEISCGASAASGKPRFCARSTYQHSIELVN